MEGGGERKIRSERERERERERDGGRRHDEDFNVEEI